MITLYNTLTRKKEEFTPIKPPFVGLYVCGPTVYGEGHLGHARSAITFDVLYRLLEHEGYRVRYVRNITDVGHLQGDSDDGKDKMAEQARLEQIEPMEVAHRYTEKYHEAMRRLGVKSPSIEPRASGHIIEQIELTKQILERGLAYEANGSIYFDVREYAKKYPYGILSGRNLEDIVSGTRTLDGQNEKRFSADFALWKKASPEHLMRWPSPWGEGFPGWHAECSAMSAKYLGEQFDIHGGGMDLMFPHHECEIAQSTAATGHGAARYWVHNNMITNGGQKMGKSLGNFITLDEFFNGTHQLLSKAYSPMVIRLFILMAHYRSTLDFSDEALAATEKGFSRLMNAWKVLEKSFPANNEGSELLEKCLAALRDDMNTSIALSYLFEAVSRINSGGGTAADRRAFDVVLGDLLGLQAEEASSGKELAGVMELVLELRGVAKANKDWATSDVIRDRLLAAGVEVKDGKEGSVWSLKNQKTLTDTTYP